MLVVKRFYSVKLVSKVMGGAPRDKLKDWPCLQDEKTGTPSPSEHQSRQRMCLSVPVPVKQGREIERNGRAERRGGGGAACMTMVWPGKDVGNSCGTSRVSCT